MRGFQAACIVGALALSGCSGGDEIKLGAGATGGGPESITPAPGGMRRLLGRQYVGSIRLIFGEGAASVAVPPADASLHDFDAIGAAELALPEAAVEQYETSAREIARAVINDPQAMARIVPCQPTGPADGACYKQFVESLGRVVWRRPLEEAEVTPIVHIAQTAGTEYASWGNGAEYAISALLQSPYFLYVIEVGEPDGTRRRLTPYELAARTSFFLLDATPSPALLDEVEAGGFDSDEEIRAVAREMLATPEAKAALRSFFDEAYRLRELGTLQKDPQWAPSVPESMREETLRLIDEIVWTQKADARDIFTADYTFVNAELAAIYGAQPPSTGFQKVELPAEQRRSGFLTQGSFLSRFAHPGKTSPTRRGAFVKDKILCDPTEPPPANVNTTLPPDEPGEPQTLKQKLLKHQEVESCASCHMGMDGIGFALENFDQIGAFRTEDNGLPVDPTGEIPGLGAFDGPRELGALIREDQRTARCIIRNFIRSSMGHLDTEGERPAVDALDAAFGESGYSIQDLMVELVASPVFQLVGEPK